MNGQQAQNGNGMLVIAVLIIGALIWHYQSQKNGSQPPLPNPAPGVIPEPATFRSHVAPIQSAAISTEDGKRLAAFYMGLADLVEGDRSGKIDSLTMLQTMNSDSGVLYFQSTPTFQTHSHIRNAVDDVLAAGVGAVRNTDGKFPRVPITETNRRTLAEAIRAIAWACQR